MKINGRKLSRRAVAKARLQAGMPFDLVYPNHQFDSSPQAIGYYRAIPKTEPEDVLAKIVSILTLSRFWKARIKIPEKKVEG